MRYWLLYMMCIIHTIEHCKTSQTFWTGKASLLLGSKLMFLIHTLVALPKWLRCLMESNTVFDGNLRRKHVSKLIILLGSSYWGWVCMIGWHSVVWKHKKNQNLNSFMFECKFSRFLKNTHEKRWGKVWCPHITKAVQEKFNCSIRINCAHCHEPKNYLWATKASFRP